VKFKFIHITDNDILIEFFDQESVTVEGKPDPVDIGGIANVSEDIAGTISAKRSRKTKVATKIAEINAVQSLSDLNMAEAIWDKNKPTCSVHAQKTIQAAFEKKRSVLLAIDPPSEG